MANYPGSIFPESAQWVNDETPLNAENLNLRDAEIRAIERSLGINLVYWAGSGPDVALSDRVRTTSLSDGGNLVLAETAGNVGVGTAFPQTQLHQRKIEGSVTFHEFEVSGLAATYSDAYADLDFTADRVGSGRSPFGRIRFQRDNAYWNNNNGSIQFWTGNSAATQGQPATLTERMRIAANGYVGIGTSSPSERLHVNGNIALGTELKFGGSEPINLFNDYGTLVSSGHFAVQGRFLSVGANDTVGNLSAQYLEGHPSSYFLPANHVYGTANAIARFTGTDTLGISNVYTSADGLRIGIGTGAPVCELDVVGSVRLKNGSVIFSPSSGELDTYLERHSAGVIGTAGFRATSIVATTSFATDSGSSVGFYGVTPQGRQTVGGQRSNPEGTLKELLQKLALIGLIIDNSVP